MAKRTHEKTRAKKPATKRPAKKKKKKKKKKTAAPPKRASRAEARAARTAGKHARLAKLFEPYVWSWFERTFDGPSPPQIASWPRIASGKSTLLMSPTGSGKTLSAFLWTLNELFRAGAEGGLENSVYVLYVSPLKALNNDIQKNLVEPLQGIRAEAKRMRVDVPEVRSLVRTGDTTANERAAMARRPPHILITTPESLYIMLATEKFREALRTVRYVIVDEIHAISDNKRGVHLTLSLERLSHLTGTPPVRIGLSATQRPLDEIARFLTGVDDDGTPRPCEIVDAGARKKLDVGVITPVDNLLEARFDAIWGSAYDNVLSLIRKHGTTLIFTVSRAKTERTALRLNELAEGDDVLVGAHHGSMSKEVRLDMEDRLKAGELDALVATASLELGIDVGSIDLVCQIESPKSVSRGMQRIGRAGHLLGATSVGRILAVDRDDLVESAVVVKAITDGRIDSTRIPVSCLDVLAQQVVGAVAADDWAADDLFRLFKRSYCYRDLTRDAFDAVLDMLAGYYTFDTEFPPYPKITWDKVNDVLMPERSTRLIAFRSSGTIPDIADYDVWFESKRTKVGQLDEGFVEELRPGDIFILGSSSWKVLGVHRNRVLVEDVYGAPPTIPFWHGNRASRTYDLGRLVGAFRRVASNRLARKGGEAWLRKTYHLDRNGAASIAEYFREQKAVTGDMPSDGLVLVERFADELGAAHIVIHSSFGLDVNDPWALGLSAAIEKTHGFRIQTATTDDGILISIPKEHVTRLGKKKLDGLTTLLTSKNVASILTDAALASPVFAGRFRHNAVRSMLVLREYMGQRTPVWLQNIRASSLLEACRDDRACPLVEETLREVLEEAYDLADLTEVLSNVASGEIEVRTVETEIPSPFTHSLLLLGQFGEAGSIPTRERRARLVHLHRELLKQILDEETLANLLDAGVAEEVEAKLQRTLPQRRAASANELARVLNDLGDLVDIPGEELSIFSRVDGDERGARELLRHLTAARRAVNVPVATSETNRPRWISSESFALYKAAFASDAKLDAAGRALITSLTNRKRLEPRDEHVAEELLASYRVLRFPTAEGNEYVAAGSWLPEKLTATSVTREEARAELVRIHARTHGPFNKYDVMERYGFAEAWVERVLERLHAEGPIARGEYLPTKAFPQLCYKANLEEIHRLTLAKLRKEMEPATPPEYTDYLVRQQGVHPSHRREGLDGLRAALAQIQGVEAYQASIERDILPARVSDYEPSLLDRLCYGGEVTWRRFDRTKLRRGHVGFCMRADESWLLPPYGETAKTLRKFDDDIPEQCDAVRRVLGESGATFFDDIVEASGLDWRYCLRAIWHLVWTCEATCDSFEAIRHGNFMSGLSGCYDLGSRPQKKGVTLDFIVKHMLENRRLDPRLGKWSPTERLVEREALPEKERAAKWAALLLDRYGIACASMVKLEVGAPSWRLVRRELARMELLGRVRRGFFVEGLAGEQYAYPQTVDALYESKLRATRTDEQADDGEMFLVSMCDPANPYGSLFDVTNASGERIKYGRTPGKYLVIQNGRPLLAYNGKVTVLEDMTRDRIAHALRSVTDKATQLGEVSVSHWNGHPVDISPARHLLTTLGFVKGRSKWASKWLGMVYDGAHLPSEQQVREAEKKCPVAYEHQGKERAPVEYDAKWVVDRAPTLMRDKVRELLSLMMRVLPQECEFRYGPQGLHVHYKGFRCIRPHIQQKQVWIHVTHKGWQPGILVTTDTNLKGAAFQGELLSRFGKTRSAIDQLTATQRK